MKKAQDMSSTSAKSVKGTELPRSMEAAKNFCSSLCKEYGYTIEFDDAWNNFGRDGEMCACAGETIVCSRFRKWNYDLLVFAVMHEIGHLQCDLKWASKRTRFVREYAAWSFAIELYTKTFVQNISIRLARFMMSNLNSYLPDYNDSVLTSDGIKESEHAFWCPLKSRVIRT